MSKTLFISEKPKVTKSLLQNRRFKGMSRIEGSKPYYGYYENHDYIHSWANGHLVELCLPQDHDPQLKEFSFDNLPIILPAKYKEKSGYEEQLHTLLDLMKRPDVTTIVNACDDDKEGEIIFREIYNLAGIDKPVLRINVSDKEESEIEAALNNMKDGTLFDGLAQAGFARQHLDSLIGDTITRASTVKLAQKKFLLSGGRVQMCLLHEIRERERAVEDFKPQTFYNLFCDVGFLAKYQTDEQILNKNILEQLSKKLEGQNLTVTSFSEKPSKQSPKDLYNISDFYKDCISKLSIAAPRAKKILQALYDDGFVSYPRTDSRHLSTAKVEKTKSIITKLQEHNSYESLAKLINIESITEKHSTFNDELVTAHHAIIPTKKLPTNLKEEEQKVYDLIVKRFLARFLPAAKYLVRHVILTDQDENTYEAKERVLVEKGFLSVFTDEEDQEEIHIEFSIPTLEDGQSLPVKSTEIKTGQTKKPSYHNESSILTFMETAGRKLDDEHLRELMKGKRIGTPATAESFIPKLLERGYILIDKNKLKTTNLGRTFIESFPVDEIKDPTYTAEMEYKIQQIQDGALTYDEFIKSAEEFAKEIVAKMADLQDKVISSIESSHQEDIEVCKCKCGGTITDKGKFFGCSKYPECNISFPKIIKSKTIPLKQIEKLIQEGKSDLIKGFKNDEGNTFEAFLNYREGKMTMSFPTAEDISIGLCPKCKNGQVLPRKNFYGCSEYKNGCEFKLPAVIKEKKIPVSQMKKLLKDGRTNFINGFIGDDGEFTAAVTLYEDRLKFQYPTKEDRTVGKCPLCNSNVLIGKSYYLCEKYRNPCTFIIGEISGKMIPVGQAQKLLSKNMTDTISGFKYKDKEGTFSAKLTYSKEEKRMKFVSSNTSKKKS